VTDCEVSINMPQLLGIFTQSSHSHLRSAVWRSGNIIRRMNEVTLCRARISTGIGDRLQAGIPSRNQLYQLSPASLRGR